MTAFVHDQFPGRVVFGVGTVDQLDEETHRLGCTRFLAINTASAGGHARRCRNILGSRAAATIDGARAHVPTEDAAAACHRARTSEADAVLALGGGSAIGLAKAVALETRLPIIAVPTTYAGSEMTPVHGTTQGGHKQTGRDVAVLPQVVIYDPEVTIDLPPAVTASTGMNALAHCAEALYARQASPATRLIAAEGARMLTAGLRRAVNHPHELKAREGTLLGSYFAGLALAAGGMALHHRICHVLGGMLGLPHGDANAVMLPQVLAYNAPAAPEETARFAQALAVADPATGVIDLARDIGAPTSLADLGVTRDDLERVAEAVSQTSGWNPRPFHTSDVLGILQAAHAGQQPAPETPTAC